jgi:peptidoglycan/LPS O-acetylase OafA/YrhL
MCRKGKERSHSQKTELRDIAALDGVRAIAAMMVVALHLSEIVGVPWSINGQPFLTTFVVFGRMGVDLFFVLSGFLLFRPYARALLFQQPWPALRSFYLRRLFRIWPGYYITLFAMLLLFAHQYLQPDHRAQLGLFLIFFMDSSRQTWQQLNGPFWTLATEWQFYMLLPLIAWGFSAIVKRLATSPQQRLLSVLCCCSALIVWGLGIKSLGLHFQDHPALAIPVVRWLLNLFLFVGFGIQGKYLEVFACGMIVCTCFTFAQDPECGRDFKARLVHLSNWLWVPGILILLCLACWHAQATGPRDDHLSTFAAFPFLNPLTPYFPWLGEPVVGSGFAICMLALLSGSPRVRWICERRFLRQIGMISYGIYMWNQKLIGWFCAQLVTYFPHLSISWKYTLCWIFVLIGLLPFCYLFYRVIEAPGIRLGTWIVQRMQVSRSSLLLSGNRLLARISRSGSTHP